MAKKISDLYVNIGAKTDDFSKGVSKVKGEGSELNKTFGKVGGMIAGAFAAERIIAFAGECSQLAQVAEGVEMAFKRIGNETMLEGLRKATKGTVSDLDLMKAAVQANNFGIPLKQLGSLLEFAHQRAKDTGQSVDYLVQSIVMGIGRKSPLILDNLGISAVQLKAKMKGIAEGTESVADVAKAVGEIASEAMGKIGDSTETTREKLDRFKAGWTNLKVEIGGAINTLIVKFMDLGKAISDAFSNDKYLKQKPIQEAVNKRVEAYKRQLEDIKKETNDSGKFWKYLNVYADQLSQRMGEIESKKGRITAKDLINLETYKQEYEYTTKLIDELAAAEDAKYTPLNPGEAKKSLGIIESLKKSIEDIKKKIESETNPKVLLKLTQQAKDLEDRLAGINSFLSGDTKETKGLLTPKTAKVTGATAPSIDMDKAWSQVGESTSRYRTFVDEVETINMDFSNSMQGFAESLANNFGAALNGTMTVGDAFLSAMADFMSSLGQQMIAVGVAGIAMKTLAMNPAAALAAGIALVALAGAVQATMSSGVGGSGGSTSTNRGAYSGTGQNELTIYIEGITKGSDIHWSQKNYNNKLDATISR